MKANKKDVCESITVLSDNVTHKRSGQRLVVLSIPDGMFGGMGERFVAMTPQEYKLFLGETDVSRTGKQNV